MRFPILQTHTKDSCRETAPCLAEAELSAELETAQGFAAIHPNAGKNATKTEAIAAAGLSTSEAHRCEQIARHSPARA